MGRLKAETLSRAETYSDRVLDVVAALEQTGKPARITNHLAGSGTSVGANPFEADEALSAKDFVRCLGIVNKELNETRFWLRLIERRGWVANARLAPLLAETLELKAMFGAMISRTRARQSAND